MKQEDIPEGYIWCETKEEGYKTWGIFRLAELGLCALVAVVGLVVWKFLGGVIEKIAITLLAVGFFGILVFIGLAIFDVLFDNPDWDDRLEQQWLEGNEANGRRQDKVDRAIRQMYE